MRIICLVFVCLFLTFAAVAQTDGSVEDVAVIVDELTLAVDDGSGGTGEERDSFLPTDVPIHCSILLSSAKPATIKMNIVFVKSVAPKSEQKVVTVSYKTNGKQNMVNFTASPEKYWTEGKYRVDIYIDGKRF